MAKAIHTPHSLHWQLWPQVHELGPEQLQVLPDPQPQPPILVDLELEVLELGLIKSYSEQMIAKFTCADV